MKTNPFNITKAVDYSDEQIKSYWVDIPEGGFTQIVKPTSPMPMLILGGKGSGKTHIMRYFSYGLQKLRYKEDFFKQFNEDGYLGIYMRCSGLNSNRFRGKGQSSEVWIDIFSYYIELWLSQLVLNTIIDIFNTHLSHIEEKIICGKIKDLFDSETKERNLDTFTSVLTYIKELQRLVDYNVNNISLTGGDLSNLEIQVTPGKLIFGIPKILESRIPLFKDIQFLYLLDEFENLTIEQQQHINTLLREKEAPSTFKIGARLYGVRTYNTNSADEENKENSEFEVYNIDKEFRDRENDYKEWAKTICVKKLSNAGYAASIDKESPHYINQFFEEFSLKELNESLKGKSDKNSRVYFNELSRELTKYKIQTPQIDQILSNLAFDQDRLLERANVFIFYRAWKDKKTDLLSSSTKIKSECEKYFLEKDKTTEHHKVLDKFKNDLIDKLCREANELTPYLGIDNFIKMSAGIPRHLLIILKHIFRWSNFNGENPFSGKKAISKESQNSGLKDAANWFLEDARLAGDTGEKMQSSIRRLGLYLKEIRFSQTPPECSISSFRINRLELDDSILKVLDYLEQYSYLINVTQRRDKNTNRMDYTYQVNGLIAPYFELSIWRRGVLSINKNEAKLIFAPHEERLFNDLISSKRRQYNPPFTAASSTLFDG